MGYWHLRKEKRESEKQAVDSSVKSWEDAVLKAKEETLSKSLLLVLSAVGRELRWDLAVRAENTAVAKELKKHEFGVLWGFA